MDSLVENETFFSSHSDITQDASSCLRIVYSPIATSLKSCFMEGIKVIDGIIEAFDLPPPPVSFPEDSGSLSGRQHVFQYVFDLEFPSTLDKGLALAPGNAKHLSLCCICPGIPFRLGQPVCLSWQLMRIGCCGYGETSDEVIVYDVKNRQSQPWGQQRIGLLMDRVDMAKSLDWHIGSSGHGMVSICTI